MDPRGKRAWPDSWRWSGIKSKPSRARIKSPRLISRGKDFSDLVLPRGEKRFNAAAADQPRKVKSLSEILEKNHKLQCGRG